MHAASWILNSGQKWGSFSRRPLWPDSWPLCSGTRRQNSAWRYIGDISWETEVWVKEAGTHLIHFDGKRFLGPYDG